MGSGEAARFEIADEDAAVFDDGIFGRNGETAQRGGLVASVDNLEGEAAWFADKEGRGGEKKFI